VTRTTDGHQTYQVSKAVVDDADLKVRRYGVGVKPEAQAKQLQRSIQEGWLLSHVHHRCRAQPCGYACKIQHGISEDQAHRFMLGHPMTRRKSNIPCPIRASRQWGKSLMMEA
jgi:hypothetical protein